MNTFREFFQPIFGMFGAMLDVWFLVFPFVLFFLFKLLWMKYIRRKYQHSTKWMLLEIIPPREIEKSPKLMESIFSGMAGVIKSLNPIEIYIQGLLPDYFSLEMVGSEGSVHFYIRTLVNYRNLLEAHFYAQYPDVEIIEVPDYVDAIPVTIPNKDWDLWGTEFEFVKPDVFPIRTYPYFDEDVTGKMIDPLAGLTEVMSKTGPGQHLWLQYLINPRGDEQKWVKEYGKKIVDELTGKTPEEKIGVLRRIGHDFFEVGANLHKGLLAQEIEYVGLESEKKELGPLEFRLTPGEKDVLKAVESNMSKQQFQTKMRFIYVGRREGFDKSFVSSFIGGIKQFNDMSLNSFKPNNDTKTSVYSLFAKERLRFRQRLIHMHYRDRDWDDGDDTFYLSTEELATVFHLPDMAVMTPTMARVSAKRGGAPANLPIE
ncbi:MAG: hypothetical protein KA034_00110 [Candidatus Moranbacteria bacterium]|nr:hypothetical protein [Candidatus Moranbacteria bacterium]